MLPLLLLPQLFSSDVYSYAMFGRIRWVYGQNPLITPPAAFPNDPLLARIAWKTTASVYGPAWIFASLPITQLARLLGNSMSVYILLYKLVAASCHVLNTALIWGVVRRRAPEHATWGALLYGWHPLALIEFAGSGHNDALMLTLILLAGAALLAERLRIATLWLVMAALIKLVAMLLIPIYGLYVLRRSAAWGKVAAQHLALGSMVVVALYAPFWQGPETLRILGTAPPLTILHSGPASWLFTKVEPRVCPRALAVSNCEIRLNARIRTGALLLFVAAYLLLLVRVPGTFDELMGRWLLALLLYAAIAAVHFEPWYGTWPLALLPFIKLSRWLVLLWGCSLLIFYVALPIPGQISHCLRAAPRAGADQRLVLGSAPPSPACAKR